ncbi:hypothetical protein CAEBREN_11194 [Caenorhabditis brenneri]|uniref:Uncharacterized protein n=1 Tax=Caenorhabditis brenneri TaxID=135651 RepID=G0NNU5_CAEBE|nr:hypothetical protein CAEBREN_11194 [Caenorhabditis brenneri]
MVILNPEPEQLELYKLKWEAEKAEKVAAKKDKAKKTAGKMGAAAGYGSTSSGEPSTSKAPGTSGFNGVGKNIDLKKKLLPPKPRSGKPPATSNQIQRSRTGYHLRGRQE